MWLHVLVVCGLLAVQVPGAEVKLEFMSVGAKTYTNVTVIGANATDLYFTHRDGIANVKLKYLNSDLQKRFHYDQKTAADAEKQQAKDDLLFQETARSNLVAEAQAATRAAQRAAATSEHSLADAWSDRSLIGRPSPVLEPQKWIGEKPALEGKFLLISFWAPWSIPCRKLVPELNRLQKKFAERLEVIGITSESETDLQTMPDPRPEYSLALDPKAQLFTAAGVSSIPTVLLVDLKGMVVYQGHPAAVTEARLERLLSSAPSE
jgi:cytochrome c biogenesis protein CcmG, thiol:disulfide interchange protein DsbE